MMITRPIIKTREIIKIKGNMPQFKKYNVGTFVPIKYLSEELCHGLIIKKTDKLCIVEAYVPLGLEDRIHYLIKNKLIRFNYVTEYKGV